MKFIINTLFIFITTGIFSQRTYIPDNNFEQALIDKGYDSGVIDNYVLTININNLNEIFLMDYNISDLTGIEDFINLDHLQIRNNNLTEINISSLKKLKTINCNDNKLEEINILNKLELEILNCNNNLLKKINTKNNTLLESINFSNNNLDSLNFSNNKNLLFVNLNNNSLKYLNIKNTNNEIINSFNTLNNPNLKCIAVDNINYSTNNWLNIDSTTYFTDNEEGCNPLPCNLLVDEFNDMLICGDYELPVLINGEYFTESNGLGNKLNSGDIITKSQTIFIYNTDASNINCTNESNFTITFNCQDSSNSFPTFFTPNNDAINDTWIVKSTKKIKEILIFNRFGKLISKPNINDGWDGKNDNKKAPSNTYWYKIIFIDNSLKYGSVTLLRK